MQTASEAQRGLAGSTAGHGCQKQPIPARSKPVKAAEDMNKGFSSRDRRLAHPSPGVFGRPWIAKRGATCRWGVVAEPMRGTRCRSSPKMQPADHMSMALV